MTIKTGIWIDKREAKIFFLEEDKERLTTIKSKVESYRPKGGSGTKIKGGPQNVVQDSKYLEREKHQLRAFFNNIISLLTETDSVVILGPAETGQKLLKEIAEHHRNLLPKIKGIERTDNMTDNQLKAWIRQYYATVSV